MKKSSQVSDITIDRGQPVIVTVTFEEDPDEVDFIWTRPGSERPNADDGFGQRASHIAKLEDCVYRYVINTRGFKAGDGAWHCTGRWNTVTTQRPYIEASIFGVYTVNDAPEQLL